MLILAIPLSITGHSPFWGYVYVTRSWMVNGMLAALGGSHTFHLSHFGKVRNPWFSPSFLHSPKQNRQIFWLIPVSLSKFTRHFIWVNRKAIGPTWNGIIVDIDLHQRFKEDMCFVCSRLPQNPTLYHHFPHESGHFWGYTRYFQRHQNIQNSLVKYALVPTVHDEFPCVSPILMINSWLIPVTLANSHGS